MEEDNEVHKMVDNTTDKKADVKSLLSVIIPTYNEENNIEASIMQIVKQVNSKNKGDWRVEILVVDDGKDKTAQIAEQVGKKVNSNQCTLQVHHSSEKRGKGGAFVYGLGKAKGDVILIMDGDLTIGGNEIPYLVNPIFNRKVDFVNGTRFIHEMEAGAMSFTNKLGNKIFAFMTSLALRMWFTDVFCGCKAFRREMLAGKLNEKEWPDLELLFKARRNGLRIMEVPVHYHKRLAGESKVTASGTGLVLFKSFLRNLFN